MQQKIPFVRGPRPVEAATRPRPEPGKKQPPPPTDPRLWQEPEAWPCSPRQEWDGSGNLRWPEEDW